MEVQSMQMEQTVLSSISNVIVFASILFTLLLPFIVSSLLDKKQNVSKSKESKKEDILDKETKTDEVTQYADKVDSTLNSDTSVRDFKAKGITPIDNTTNEGWRCVCEGGFLPPGFLTQSMGGMEAVFRMSTGQCYHKN